MPVAGTPYDFQSNYNNTMFASANVSTFQNVSGKNYLLIIP